MEIKSLNNPKVKEWNKLKEKKYRDETNTFLIEGDHLVKEALKKGLVKELIALNTSFKQSHIPFYLVTESILKKITTQITISKVVAVCYKLSSNPIKGNICLLDNIQDPGNLGTIIRSAKAFNIDTIIMSLDTVDLYNPKVIRATEGMIFYLNFIKEDLEVILPQLIKDGYKIYGSHVQKGTNLKKVTFFPKNGIIIGNEGSGMQEKLIKYCQELINIPLNSSVESLNAGVAASIIFYELNRKEN